MSGRRAEALRGAATARSLAAEERAQQALTELDRRGAAITFPGGRDRGRRERALPLRPPTAARRDRATARRAAACPIAAARMRERASEESIRARLRGALEENKRLRAENAQLREELALAHGRVRELELDAATGHE